MRRVRVVHWKDQEAAPLLEACRAAGCEVEYSAAGSVEIIREIRRSPPDAVIIDLSRIPSRGREFAFAIRSRSYTRRIPIVFVGGAPDKVAPIRERIPDAAYASLGRLGKSIRDACANPVAEPVRPPSVVERYGSRTVAQKLGIRSGSTIGLVDAPRDYAALIGSLPQDAEIVEEPEDACHVTLWFVRDPRGYRAALRRMRAIAVRSKLWVIWPKGGGNGLTGNTVREFASEAGLVDYKICALGACWSGMVFAVRRA